MKEKAIQPVSIWANGETKEANAIQAYLVFDDLIAVARFFYSLCAVNGENTEVLTSGNVSITGEDYAAWGVSQDINDSAFTYICNILNIQLVSNDN